MAILISSWPTDEVPPAPDPVTVTTNCQGPVTRQCQDAHNELVRESLILWPLQEGGEITHSVAEGALAEILLRVRHLLPGSHL